MATGIQTAHRPETYATLQQRIAAEQNRITHGVAAGTLSGKEAQAMRARLQQLEGRLKNDAFDANGLSHGANFDRQLDRLGEVVHRRAADTHMNLDKRIAHTQQRIDAGLQSGHLTQGEAAGLKSQLEALKQRYAGAQLDKLSPAERQALGTQLKTLNHAVSREARDDQANFNKELANMKARVAAGVQNGTLNPAEAQRLTKQLEGLQQRLAGAQIGGMDPKERSVIQSQMQHLSQRIFNQKHDTQVDLTKLSTTVGQRIDAGVNSNKIPAAQATALRNELAALQQAASNPALNATQRANLAAQLNTLSARVTAAIRG